MRLEETKPPESIAGPITAHPREELDLSSPLFDALTLDAARDEISSLRAQLAAERAVTASVRTALGLACADVVALGERARERGLLGEAYEVASADSDYELGRALAEARIHGLEQTIAGLRIDVEGLGDRERLALDAAEVFAERMERERVERDVARGVLDGVVADCNRNAEQAVGLHAALEEALAEVRERAEELSRRAEETAEAVDERDAALARAKDAETMLRYLRGAIGTLARTASSHAFDWRDAATCHISRDRPEIASEQREAAEVFDALAAFARSLLAPVPPAEGMKLEVKRCGHKEHVTACGECMGLLQRQLRAMEGSPASPPPDDAGAAKGPTRLLSGDDLTDALRRLSPPPAIDDYEEPVPPPPATGEKEEHHGE